MIKNLLWKYTRKKNSRVGSSKKLNIELSYKPAISLLGIYSEELKARNWTDICTPMFITALFTIAKRWKQPTDPSMDEWIKKMWYIHAMEYYSGLKKEWNSDRYYMDETWKHAKWNKPNLEGKILYDSIYMRDLE